MSIGVSRTTEPLRFDTGIGQTGFAEIADSPAAGQPQKTLLPGSTTVTQAIDELFPAGNSVRGEIAAALVAANTAALRTPGGFGAAARGAAAALRGRKTDAADAAAAEIEALLADTDLFERYRMSLLET